MANPPQSAPSIQAGGAEAVPDAVAPPPHHPRFPLFDGLRAIAVLSVVAVHANIAASGPVGVSTADRFLSHLNVGVTIFFVISGFLLYRPLIAHRTGGAAAPAVTDYAKRRFLRIYPAYWLILTVLTLLPGLTGVFQGNWWQQYAILDTLPVHSGLGCAGAPLDCGLAQTWSLVVEVTFYALLPLYALVAAWLFRRLATSAWLRAELLFLGTLSTLSVILRFTELIPISSRWIDASVLGSVLWFALGMGLAVASVAVGENWRSAAIPRLIGSRPLLPWLLAAALYLGLALWLPANPFLARTTTTAGVTTFLLDRGNLIVGHVGFALIAALLVMPAVFGEIEGGLPRRILANRFVAWIGLISYGIFLWHYVVTLQLDGHGRSFVLVLGVTLAVSIPCAAASYYLLERPFLRLKYRRLSDLLGPSRTARS